MSGAIRIGSYARSGGAGLYALRRDGCSGWIVDGAAPVPNASFGTYSARHDLYYFVDEQAEGAVGVYRAQATRFAPIARVASGGAEPCHLVLDRAQSLLAVANYASGSIALFRLDPSSGAPITPPLVRRNSGSGPVADRQEGPHAHCVCFSHDGNWLYHVDLGTDEILAHAIDRATGSLGARQVAFAAPAGSGPRHLILHPTLPLALLASEMASNVTVLAVGAGRLTARQTISTLPDRFTGTSLCGQIMCNAGGDRAYATNRGADSVTVFSWDADGRLARLQHVPSGGAAPRAFVLLEAERQVLVANEEGGSIASFALHADGTLSAAGTPLAVPGAAFPFVMAG